jgi:hypothetical protein
MEATVGDRIVVAAAKLDVISGTANHQGGQPRSTAVPGARGPTMGARRSSSRVRMRMSVITSLTSPSLPPPLRPLSPAAHARQHPTNT